MSSRARTKEVGQCSYRVAKQLRQGLPWELIHALFPWEKSRTPMSGTIVLYDGGAVAPHNQHGARGHRGGGGYRRANISQAPSQSKKLKTGVCLPTLPHLPPYGVRRATAEPSLHTTNMRVQSHAMLTGLLEAWLDAGEHYGQHLDWPT